MSQFPYMYKFEHHELINLLLIQTHQPCCRKQKVNELVASRERKYNEYKRIVMGNSNEIKDITDCEVF